MIRLESLAQKAEAIRAERQAIATARPLTVAAARVVLPVLDDHVLGVTEYAAHFDWSRRERT